MGVDINNAKSKKALAEASPLERLPHLHEDEPDIVDIDAKPKPIIRVVSSLGVENKPAEQIDEDVGNEDHEQVE